MYWLKVLRSGAMDIERSWEVFMNYLNIMKNYPLFFEKAYIPTQLKLIFEQQVKIKLQNFKMNDIAQSHSKYIGILCLGSYSF